MNDSSVFEYIEYTQTYRYKNAKIHARMSPKESDNRFSNDHGYHGNRYWMKMMQMNFLLKIMKKLSLKLIKIIFCNFFLPIIFFIIFPTLFNYYFLGKVTIFREITKKVKC